MRTILGATVVAALIAAGTAAQAAEKLRIGFVSTFSGPAAIIGKHQKDGFELALDHLGRKAGGREVEVIYGDDQVKPDVGVSLVDRMIKKDKVHIISGFIWSHVLLAAQKRITRAKIFLIGTNAGASPMAGELCNPYFFTTSWNNDQNAEATGKLVSNEGVKNVVFMTPNYRAGKDNLEGFKRTFNGRITHTIMTKINQVDYQAEISQVRAAKPDALVAFLPAGMGIAFTKQWAASGLKDRIPFYNIFTVSWLSLPVIGEAALGTFHTNYWGVDLDFPANKRFVKDFVRKYKYMRPTSRPRPTTRRS